MKVVRLRYEHHEYASFSVVASRYCKDHFLLWVYKQTYAGADPGIPEKGSKIKFMIKFIQKGGGGTGGGVPPLVAGPGAPLFNFSIYLS